MRDDTGNGAADSEAAETPRLRVLSGTPTPEELVAVVAVMAAAAGGQALPERGTASRSTWAEPASRVRRTPAAGPGEWRASARPTPG